MAESSKIVAFAHELDDMWRQHNKNKSNKSSIYNKIDTYLDHAQNPYEAFLDLAEVLLIAPIKYREKVTECVWKELGKKIDGVRQLQPSEGSASSIWLSNEILLRSVHLSFEDKMRHFSSACISFKFREYLHLPQLMKVFTEKLAENIASGNYRAVAHILDHIGPENLPVSDMLGEEQLRKLSLFLICKKEISLLRRILSTAISNERVSYLLSTLDSLLGLEICDNTEPNSNIERASSSRSDFYRSPLCTTLSTLIEDLKVPLVYCPNVTLFHLMELTEFMVRATFGPDAEMDVSSFREFVLGLAVDNDRYSLFVVSYLCRFGLISEAIFFRDRLNVNDFTVGEQSYATTTSQRDIKQKMDSCDSGFEELHHYNFPLAREAIKFVDSLVEYRLSMAYILSKSNSLNDSDRIAGFDSEWPAIVPLGKHVTISVIQIAVSDQVFIIDMENLAGIFAEQDWDLLKAFFSSKSLKKVAFGFESDQSSLRDSFPIVFADLKAANLIDLESVTNRLWKQLKASTTGPVKMPNYPVFIDANASAVPSSLSDVARTFIGRGLNKMYRLSNWSRRPLDENQIMYAANDAYCLLELHDAIFSVIKKSKLDSSDEASTVKVDLSSFHLLFDATLIDLGLYLKQLGFDVAFMTIIHDTDFLLNKASEDHRTLVLPAHSVPKKDVTCQIVGAPLETLKDQAEFIAQRLGVTINCADIEPHFYISNPLQRLHTTAAHLPDRGIASYQDINYPGTADDEPPFITICRLHSVASKILMMETMGVGATKHEAKNRAATNMILRLTEPSLENCE